eukprot:scaffold2514_cov373-Prasinococcus_capsulatus_cf.AAC.11
MPVACKGSKAVEEIHGTYERAHAHAQQTIVWRRTRMPWPGMPSQGLAKRARRTASARAAKRSVSKSYAVVWAAHQADS